MTFLIALTVLFAVLSLFNLVLTVGVMRRLREMSRQDRSVSALQAERKLPILAGGERVGDFAAVTVQGAPISEQFLAAGPVLTGVFAHGCTPCRERLPEFIAHVKSHRYSPADVLVVLVGGRGDFSVELVELETLATVIMEGRQGPVAAALGVKGFPALAVIGAGGTVRVSGSRVEDLTSVPASV